MDEAPSRASCDTDEEEEEEEEEEVRLINLPKQKFSGPSLRARNGISFV